MIRKNKGASLTIKTRKASGLQDRLGKQNFHEDMRKLN